MPSNSSPDAPITHSLPTESHTKPKSPSHHTVTLSPASSLSSLSSLSPSDKEGSSTADTPTRAPESPSRVTRKGPRRAAQTPKKQDGKEKERDDADGDGAEKAKVKAATKRTSASSGKKRKTTGKAWDVDNLLTSKRSPLLKVNLRDILLLEDSWDALSLEKQEAIISLFPADSRFITITESGSRRPNVKALSSSDAFRCAIAAYQDNIRNGRYDKEWVEQAKAASERRVEGYYDEAIDEKLCKDWGVEKVVLEEARRLGKILEAAEREEMDVEEQEKEEMKDEEKMDDAEQKGVEETAGEGQEDDTSDKEKKGESTEEKSESEEEDDEQQETAEKQPELKNKTPEIPSVQPEIEKKEKDKYVKVDIEYKEVSKDKARPAEKANHTSKEPSLAEGGSSKDKEVSVEVHNLDELEGNPDEPPTKKVKTDADANVSPVALADFSLFGEPKVDMKETPAELMYR